MHARPDPLTFVGSVGYGLSPDPSYIILRRARKTNMYLLNEAGFGQPLRLPPEKVSENKLIDDEINHGTSVKDLTNKVFWLRHPELRGCRLPGIVQRPEAIATGVDAYSCEGLDIERMARPTQELAGL